VLAAIDHIFKWGCTVRRSPDAVSSEIVLVLVVVLVLDSRRCSRFPPRLRVTQRSVWRQDKQRRREESVEDEDDDEYEND